jgi:D-amino-acid dehydrogenase
MSSSSAVVSSAPASPTTWPSAGPRGHGGRPPAGPALETSFANAGEVSPGYSAPWAGPGVPIKAIKWMLMHHSPLVIKPMLDPAMWRWGLAMLRNCTEAPTSVNKSRMVRWPNTAATACAAARRDRHHLRRAHPGHAAAVPHPEAARRARPRTSRSCKQSGVPFEVLDRAGYLEVEPALARCKHKFVGALRLPGDETGDCFKFTQCAGRDGRSPGRALPLRRQHQGHRARWAAHHRRAHRRGAADRRPYVVALGSYSTALLRAVGIRIPVYPVKGFSITVPITDAAMRARVHHHGRDPQGRGHPPRRPHPGRRHGAAVGLRPEPDRGRRRTLEFVVTDLFPRGGDVARPSSGPACAR